MKTRFVVAILASMFLANGAEIKSTELQRGKNESPGGFKIESDIAPYTFADGTSAWSITFSVPNKHGKLIFSRCQLMLETKNGRLLMSVPVKTRPGNEGETIIDFFADRKQIEGYKLRVQYAEPPIGHLLEEFVILVDSYFPKKGEQAGTGQPATRSESKSEGGDKPQPETEGRSR